MAVDTEDDGDGAVADALLDDLERCGGPGAVGGLSEQICRRIGSRAQVVGRTPKEIARLRRTKEPILSTWARDLVMIAGERSALGTVA